MNQNEHPSNQIEAAPQRPEASAFFGKNLTVRQLLTGRPRQILIAVLFAIVAGILLIPLMAANQNETSLLDEKTILPVTVEIAEAVSEYEQYRLYTGTIRSKRASDLSFELSGEVVELHVDTGSQVDADQVLARLDTRAVSAQRDELVARRNQAQAVLDELEAGPRKETVEAARAEVNSLKAQLELSKLNLKRREILVAGKSISREEYEQALYDHQATMEQLNASQKRLEELEAGTRKEKINAQKAVVEQLNANIRAVDVQLDKSVLKAPYSGKISQRLLDEGSTAVATQPILRIVESEHLEAWIGLPVEIATAVSKSKKQELLINNHEIVATKLRLIPELNSSTRTQTVIFELPSEESTSSAGIVPGQIVRISLKQTMSTDGFWVPSTSLVQSSKGLWSVFVVELVDGEQKVARRDVEVIENSGNRSLVRGTLSAGEKLITEGVHRVVPGQSVQIIGE